MSTLSVILTLKHTTILPTTLLSHCLCCCKVYCQVNERVEEGSFELVASYSLSEYFTTNSLREREKEREGEGKKEREIDRKRKNEKRVSERESERERVRERKKE